MNANVEPIPKRRYSREHDAMFHAAKRRYRRRARRARCGKITRELRRMLDL